MQILFSYFAKNRFYPSRTTFVLRNALFFVAVSVGNFTSLRTRRVGNYKPYRNFIGTL